MKIWIPAALALTLALSGCGAAKTKKASSEAETQAASESLSENTESTTMANGTESTESTETSAAVENEEAVSEAPKEEVIIKPTSISASSTLANQGENTYDAKNAQDGNMNTAWVEGVTGDGIGEYLEFSIPEGTEIIKGTIYPGYYKNEDIFKKNNAISKFRISSGNTSYTIDSSEAASSFSSCTSGGWTFYLDQSLISNGIVRVTIEEVRKGNKYSDTCISEISFSGYEPAGAESGSGSGDKAADGSNSAGSKSGTDAAGNKSGTDAAGNSSGTAGVSGAGTSTQMGDENLTETTVSDIAGLAYWTTLDYMGWNGYCYAGKSLKESDMDNEQKASEIYCYQYNCEDSRISRDTLYNTASEADMKTICQELTGSTDCFDTFLSRFVDQRSGDSLSMNSMGDYGGGDDYFFQNEACSGIGDDGRMVVTADVVTYAGNNKYKTMGKVTIYLTGNGGSAFQGWRLDEMKYE